MAQDSVWPKQVRPKVTDQAYKVLTEAVALLQREPETRHYAVALSAASSLIERPMKTFLAPDDKAVGRRALELLESIGDGAAIRGLRLLLRGTNDRSPQMERRAVQRRDKAGLTPRQHQVLVLLSRGLTNEAIARRLQTSAKTVEHHVSAILAALNADNRTTAAYLARQYDLL